MILGDVLATIAVIVFSLLAIWAGGVLCALLFPTKTKVACDRTERSAWGMFAIGLAVLTPLSFLAAVSFAPVATRWFGMAVIGLMLGIALLGSGGVFRLVAKRIKDNSPEISELQAIGKGGALIVVAELMPFFGWFFVFPFVLIASLGAGTIAFLARPERTYAEAPPLVEAQ